MKYLICAALLATPAIADQAAAEDGIADQLVISSCTPHAHVTRLLRCTATNHSTTAIAALEVAIHITQPGRSVAWLDTTDSPQFRGPGAIPGGIEPGETIQLDVMAPQLPRRADRDLIQIDVTALRATTADGVVIE